MDSIKNWFNELSEQDQKITLIAGALVSIILVYLLIISPLNEGVNKLEIEVASRIKSDLWMSQQVSIIKSNSSIGSAVGGSLPLTSIINSTTKKFNLAVSRRDSKSPNEMQVWFDNVSFDSFLRWVAEVESKHNVSVASVNIRSRENDGITSINVKLLK
ncbi:MAG: general secretion pathway protein M [Polaribacter sp.]|jgi:general secretion pathway protein M